LLSCMFGRRVFVSGWYLKANLTADGGFNMVNVRLFSKLHVILKLCANRFRCF
jgi:hypothetical protein